MNEPDEVASKSREMAVAVVNRATPTERELLSTWAKTLIAIRDSDLSMFDKIKQSISETANSPALLPIFKVAFQEIEKVVWSDRGIPARFAIVAATGALALSGSGAGIAALGGAIGLPLWVVFGAGGAFIGTIVDEIAKQGEDDK